METTFTFRVPELQKNTKLEQFLLKKKFVISNYDCYCLHLHIRPSKTKKDVSRPRPLQFSPPLFFLFFMSNVF